MPALPLYGRLIFLSFSKFQLSAEYKIPSLLVIKSVLWEKLMSQEQGTVLLQLYFDLDWAN